MVAGKRVGGTLVFTLNIGNIWKCQLYGPAALPQGKDPRQHFGHNGGWISDPV